MRAVVQRVARASVAVDGCVKGSIGPGLLVFLGVGREDCLEDVAYLSGKIANLRIFEDGEGKLNLSLLDTGGNLMAVSQFTLYGDCRHGRRPGFAEAAPAQKGKELYEAFVKEMARMGIQTATGVFQAFMQVDLVNDGPVTILLDSKKTF